MPRSVRGYPTEKVTDPKIVLMRTGTDGIAPQGIVDLDDGEQRHGIPQHIHPIDPMIRAVPVEEDALGQRRVLYEPRRVRRGVSSCFDRRAAVVAEARAVGELLPAVGAKHIRALLSATGGRTPRNRASLLHPADCSTSPWRTACRPWCRSRAGQSGGRSNPPC